MSYSCILYQKPDESCQTQEYWPSFVFIVFFSRTDRRFKKDRVPIFSFHHVKHTQIKILPFAITKDNP